MGLFSREKGRREEQGLVLYLSKLGYKAERILRQYQAQGQPDVKTLAPEELTFEMKSRAGNFKRIYDLYFAEKDDQGTLSFVMSPNSTAVAVNTDFAVLHGGGYTFANLALFPPGDKALLKVYNRLVGLKELKQDADYLVIKDNNKPRLFIRYWG